MEIPGLWPLTTGEDVKIGILDTGIAPDHRDLLDNIVCSKDFTNSKYGAYDQNGHGTHVASSYER